MWHVILIHHLTPSGTGSPLHVSPATLKSETNGSIRKEKQQTNKKSWYVQKQDPRLTQKYSRTVLPKQSRSYPNLGNILILPPHSFLLEFYPLF